MEQIQPQVEFLQRLYLLNETAKSVAERAEVWAKKEKGTSIPFHHWLLWSPLAQRVVRDLIYWLSDPTWMLGAYTVDADPSAFQLLEDLGSRSLESGRGDPEGHTKNSNALDLNALELAARTLSQIIDNVFENSLFRLPWPETESNLNFITVNLRLLDQKLEEKLYWLGEIFEDLGKIMPSDEAARYQRAPRTSGSIKEPEQRLNTNISL